jgi:hypothetical protein
MQKKIVFLLSHNMGLKYHYKTDRKSISINQKRKHLSKVGTILTLDKQIPEIAHSIRNAKE